MSDIFIGNRMFWLKNLQRRRNPLTLPSLHKSNTAVSVPYMVRAMHLQPQLNTFWYNFVLFSIEAAVKLNSSTKETSKKVLEQELANWFGNSRDRGEGGRKATTNNRE